jgi:hypothetical protein
MSSIPKEKAESRDALYVVHEGESQDLLQYVHENCIPLLDSDAFVDRKGTIFIVQWGSLPPGKSPVQPFAEISSGTNAGDIYVQHPTSVHRAIVKEIKKDGGAVETAIRFVGHIFDTEETQSLIAHSVLRRASESLDLFKYGLAHVSDEELAGNQQKTIALLRETGLDTDHINRMLDENKRKMIRWIIKASGGKDTLKRRNDLITRMAISAAYRVAVERSLGIDEITAKYGAMGEALSFARALSREACDHVVRQISLDSPLLNFLPQATSDRKKKIALGMLRTIYKELGQPQVKAYRTASMVAQNDLANAIVRDQIPLPELGPVLLGIQADLQFELDRHKDIYPPPADS